MRQLAPNDCVGRRRLPHGVGRCRIVARSLPHTTTAHCSAQSAAEVDHQGLSMARGGKATKWFCVRQPQQSPQSTVLQKLRVSPLHKPTLCRPHPFPGGGPVSVAGQARVNKSQVINAEARRAFEAGKTTSRQTPVNRKIDTSVARPHLEL